ncbi:transporter substrate-binding domain-containing protein [Maribacter sp. 2308TA10-17]|uniref:transporter substrate-binding domain-containing protein n=1 Tax=Maribacter sp. 2308TA10-17 TaxID=3386276 RepID=UPI0039BD4949
MKKIALIIIISLFNLPLSGQTQQDTLLVGYTTAPPFIVQEGELLEGINIWLWQRTAADLNLNYKLVPMGFRDMLDALKTGEIDVSINPLTVTSERSKAFEFTNSYYAAHSTIAISEATTLEKLIGFLKQFFNQDFLKGLFVLLFIIFWFGMLGWYFERKENPEHFRNSGSGIWDGMWWSAVTLTTVGYGDKAPKTKMGKITALVLMFGGLLFISGLTASIASSLTVNQLSSSPDGFMAFKERKVGTIENSGAMEYLNKHFFKDISGYSGVVPGLQDLKNGNVTAFMYDEPILKYRIQEDAELSNLQILPVKFDVQFYAFGIAKQHAELEKVISQQILSITETQEWEVVLNEFGLTDI